MRYAPPHSPRLALLLLIAIGVTACRHADTAGFDHPGTDLPTWPLAPADATVQSIYERESALQGWRAQGVLEIEGPDDSARLEAIALADRIQSGDALFRLRASKLGRSVMDLVYRDEKTWLWVRGDDHPALPPEAGLTRLPPLSLRQMTLKRPQTTPVYFVFDATWPGATVSGVQAWVHRPTRTLHRIEFASPDGPITLALRYRPTDPAPTLDALKLNSPAGHQVLLQLDTVEINPQLQPALFQPLPGSRLLTR